MWMIINRDSKKDSLIIEITRISFFFLYKKNVNKYNNYTCEHDEHLLYQNKKNWKVKTMWVIVSRDNKRITLSLISL